MFLTMLRCSEVFGGKGDNDVPLRSRVRGARSVYHILPMDDLPTQIFPFLHLPIHKSVILTFRIQIYILIGFYSHIYINITLIWF